MSIPRSPSQAAVTGCAVLYQKTRSSDAYLWAAVSSRNTESQSARFVGSISAGTLHVRAVSASAAMPPLDSDGPGPLLHLRLACAANRPQRARASTQPSAFRQERYLFKGSENNNFGSLRAHADNRGRESTSEVYSDNSSSTLPCALWLFAKNS